MPTELINIQNKIFNILQSYENFTHSKAEVFSKIIDFLKLDHISLITFNEQSNSHYIDTHTFPLEMESTEPIVHFAMPLVYKKNYFGILEIYIHKNKLIDSEPILQTLQFLTRELALLTYYERSLHYTKTISTQCIYKICHDIRNPIAAILLSCELLHRLELQQNFTLQSEQVHKLVDTIKTTANRVEKLIKTTSEQALEEKFTA